MNTMPLAFWNGQLVPQDQMTIAPHDAGFVYGATLTDFCRTYRHRLFRWPDHLARLRADCKTCRVSLPYSNAELTAIAEDLVAKNSKQIAAEDDLALITFVTPGPLGYLVGQGGNGPPTVGMHTFPLPRERYRRFFSEGAVLGIAGQMPASQVPGRVKHRSRLHWWLANQETLENLPPGTIAMLVDEQTGAADTAIGAVLAVANGVVFRAPRGSVLESISLAVIEELCGLLDVRFEEGNVPAILATASEVLLAGTAFGVASVRRVVAAPAAMGASIPQDGKDYPWPGPIYSRLQTAWSELVGLSIAEQMVG